LLWPARFAHVIGLCRVDFRAEPAEVGGAPLKRVFAQIGGRRQIAQSHLLREYAALFQLSKRMKMASRSIIVIMASA
jgi:hypothetical protein